MPPPEDGNEYLPFERMIEIKRLDDTTFQSVALPFTPGGASGSWGSSYGGHVYSQAAWAACHTVAEGFRLSNVSGNFLLAGLPTVPYIYRVQILRDGRSYCTRIVQVTQREEQGIMFTCTCVFKKPETGPLEVQSGIKLRDRYKLALAGKNPWDFEECPSMDIPSFWREQAQGRPNDEFPGLQCTKVDMRKYNEGKHPLDRRQIIFYRSLGTLTKDANLHLVAHLYASDRNSLFNVSNLLGIGHLYSGIGSLIHHVVFHSPAEEMDFGEDLGPEKSKWFASENRFTRYEGGRTMFQSRMWNPEGRHVATIVQDGMIRLPRDGKGREEVEEIVKGWGEQEEVEMVRRRERKL